MTENSPHYSTRSIVRCRCYQYPRLTIWLRAAPPCRKPRGIAKVESEFWTAGQLILELLEFPSANCFSSSFTRPAESQRHAC